MYDIMGCTFTLLEIEMNDIVVEFSGWIVADPYKTKFFKVGSLYSEDSGKQDTRPETINGKQWLELDESERSDYVPDNLIDAQRDAFDFECWALRHDRY